MTKEDLLVLFNGLNNLGSLTGVKFSYFVAKNLNTIKPEVEAIEKTLEFTESYQKFENERIALAKDMAKKDAIGNPIIENGSYKVENQEDFIKKLEEIKLKYPEEIKEREKQVKEYKELLKTPSKVNLHKIKLEDVPKEITVNQMYTIRELIEE